MGEAVDTAASTASMLLGMLSVRQLETAGSEQILVLINTKERPGAAVGSAALEVLVPVGFSRCHLSVQCCHRSHTATYHPHCDGTGELWGGTECAQRLQGAW